MNLAFVIDGQRRLMAFYEEKSTPPPSPLELLSKRERQIAVLISRGLEGKEIAASLKLSEHTIAHHRKNIFRKLGVRNAPEMTRKVVEEEAAWRNYLRAKGREQ